MAATGATDFDIATLRARRTNKWHKFPPDVLPAWVADMDFGVAPSITAALTRLTENQEYGYAAREGALAAAFVRRMERRFGWHTDPADTVAIGDLVQASFSSVMAFSEPGDAVLLQLPSYPPFMRAIEDTGRRLIANPMRDNGTRWVLDLAAYEAAPDPRTRVLIFCHPQNPTGRAFSRAELEAVAAFAIRHDLMVVSDEIHADIVYPGNTHIPLASLHPEIAARTITITSATKSFNIPALRCAVMHFGAPALKERFFEPHSGAIARLAGGDRRRCHRRGLGRRTAMARRDSGASASQPRLAGTDHCCGTSGRDDAGAGGDLSGLARLSRAGTAGFRRAVLPGPCQSRTEFRRNIRRSIRRLRAPEFRDAGADPATDRGPYGGGGAGSVIARWRHACPIRQATRSPRF